MSRIFALFCSFVLLLIAGCMSEPAFRLTLAQDGVTSFCIVPPANPSEVDLLAVAELQRTLQQATEATFPVVNRNEWAPGRDTIFVGWPPGKLLESSMAGPGQYLFLGGKGSHGNLDSVMGFLEEWVGWRWYSDGVQFGAAAAEREPGEGQPVVPLQRTLMVTGFRPGRSFAFPYRQLTYARQFHYLHGINMGYRTGSAEGIVSKARVVWGSHTLYHYIPPRPEDRHAGIHEWQEKRDYFETNPEFFSLNKAGQRVTGLQLCFSNAELRKELTANILDHIRRLHEADDGRLSERPLIVDISAMDHSGAFCHCEPCQALVDRYQSPGGPLFDYLFELCPLVDEHYHNTWIRTMAYRLAQSQKPPVMPAGQRFPDNLIVQFANVEDDVDKDWHHPSNRGSYEDLLAWCKLTPNIWTWYYPNSYYNGGSIPSANNIRRLVTDLRLMKAAGVQGVFIEQGSWAVPAGFNFTQLQTYIYQELFKDLDKDVDALILAFTNHHYGAAAPLSRTYLAELEAAQEKASEDTSVAAGRSINRVMTGLTPEMLRRWQGYFEQMEELTADQPLPLKNVRRLRQTLDYTTLANWNELHKAYPDIFSDHQVVKARLAPTPPQWGFDTMVEEWELAIQLAGKEKPLPAPFDTMEPSMVRRFAPERTPRWDTVGGPKRIIESEAAFGYGTVVDSPNSPFSFGFYQQDNKHRGPTVVLEPDKIERGVYRLYPLGEIQVSPDSIIWFGWSWSTQLHVGQRLYAPPSPDNDNRYDVYVSLKFTPKLADYRHYPHHSVPPPEVDFSVLCDQIIFVKKTVP